MVIFFPFIFALFVTAVAVGLFFFGLWMRRAVGSWLALLIATLLGTGTLVFATALTWAFLEFRSAHDEMARIVMGAMSISAAIPTVTALICTVILVMRSVRPMAAVS